MQNKITIFFQEGDKEDYDQDYKLIMDELTKIENVKWILLDYNSGNLISQDNILACRKAKAAKVTEVFYALNNIKSLANARQEFDQLNLKYSNLEEQLGIYIRLHNELQIKRGIQEADLWKENKELKEEIKKHKQDLQNFKNDIPKQVSNSEQLVSNLNWLTEQIRPIQENNTALSQKIIVLQQQITIQESQALEEKKSKEVSEKLSEKLSEQLQEKEKIIKDQRNKLETLTEDVDNKSQEINYLKNQSLSLSNQSQQKNQLIQETPMQQKPVAKFVEELYVKQDQKQEVNYDLNYFGTHKSEQEEKKNDNLLKFFQSLLKKCSEDMKNARENRKDLCLLETKLQRLEIYSIELDEKQFKTNIKEQNFFFRDSSIKQTDIKHDYNKIQQSMCLEINSQQLNIKEVHKGLKSQIEAKDIILNMLIVQGYFKLFVSHLEHISKEYYWNLKIPKQFLVKDDQDNYYVYQESISTSKNFVVFENFSKVGQFMSSFFQYFYHATNKNFALTECKFEEQQLENQEQEIIIDKIVIHSNFSNIFSILDEGSSKITKFEMQSPRDKPIYQSFDIQNLAQSVWNGNLK